jgi:hypothetical protein
MACHPELCRRVRAWAVALSYKFIPTKTSQQSKHVQSSPPSNGLFVGVYKEGLGVVST